MRLAYNALHRKRKYLTCSFSHPSQSGHISETLPDPDSVVADLPKDRPLRVFAEYEYVRDYLTDSRFVVTDVAEEADILWLVTHFKDYK